MSVSSSTSSSAPTTSALGIGSGLDLNSIVDGLMKIEAQSQTRLKNQLTNHNSLVNVYQQLNSKFSTLQTAAQGLNLPSSWQVKAATSSSTNVSATATTAAISGSLSFVVKNLASAQTLASSGTVSDPSTVVRAGSFLAGVGGAIGLANVTGTGLTTGAHTIAVTQASTGASQSGATPLASSVTFTGTETLTANVGGVAKSYTMRAGTYNANDLTQMINDVSNGDLKASTNANGTLKLTTANEGSASSLQITGGTALASLGLAASGTSNGTDGIVTVDGVANTVSDIHADGSNSVVLNGSAGTVNASFSGGLRVGSANYKNIDLGDGKLSTIVSNLNAASVGVTASVVQVSPGQYKMQVQSSTTGSAGKISADLSSLSSVLGSFQTVSDAADATLQVGNGAGAYTITSSSNSVSGVMPGVTLNLTTADPTKTVTVSVGGDSSTLSNRIAAMVTSANDAIKFIKDNSTYDAKTGASGYLLGNSTAQRLQQGIYSAMSSSLGGMDPSQIGIKLGQDGAFSFDTAKFASAYQANPEQVASLFVEGGTTGPSTGNAPGLAEKVATLTKAATDSVNGWVTTAITGENKTISDLNKQISDWDTRLAKRREVMVAQFAAMDTAVANFKSQQTWLASQIAQL